MSNAFAKIEVDVCFKMFNTIRRMRVYIRINKKIDKRSSYLNFFPPIFSKMRYPFLFLHQSN